MVYHHLPYQVSPTDNAQDNFWVVLGWFWRFFYKMRHHNTLTWPQNVEDLNFENFLVDDAPDPLQGTACSGPYLEPGGLLEPTSLVSYISYLPQNLSPWPRRTKASPTRWDA